MHSLALALTNSHISAKEKEIVVCHPATLPLLESGIDSVLKTPWKELHVEEECLTWNLYSAVGGNVDDGLLQLSP